MSGGKKTTTQTSTQQAMFPDYAKPEYQKALTDITSQYNNPDLYSVYQGNTVAPFSSQTQQGLDLVQQRALAGSPLARSGSTEFQKTIEGQYLTPESNPYLQSTIDFATKNLADKFATSSIPALQASFAQSGRYGSGAQQGAFSDVNRDYLSQQANTINQLAGANYGQERQNQLQAALAAPNYAQNDYSDFAKLLGVGTAYDTQAQNLINADIQKFYGEQAGQGQALTDYINRLQAVAPLGSTSTAVNTEKNSGNKLATGLGLAAIAAAPFTGGASLALAGPMLSAGMGGGGSSGGAGGLSPLASLFGATGATATSAGTSALFNGGNPFSAYLAEASRPSSSFIGPMPLRR